jgi:hypothetical protein
MVRGDAAVVVALAAGATAADAASRSGVSLRTTQRRLQDTDFCRSIAAERERLVSRALGRLSDASAAFADVLLEVAQDRDAPPSARVSAARAGLDIGTRLHESVELAARLDRLEERFADYARDDVTG